MLLICVQIQAKGAILKENRRLKHGHIKVVAHKGGKGFKLIDSEAGFLGWGAYRLMEKTSLYKTM